MFQHTNRELKRRLEKVQQAVIDARAGACIINTSVNQYYICNFIFDGYLYIVPDAEPVLFVRKPAGIEGNRVEYIRKPEQMLDLLPKYDLKPPRKLLIESDVMPYNSAIRLQTALHIAEVMNISGKMREIRSIKSESELNEMRESAKIQAQVYAQIPGLYRKEMTDVEFQAEVEYLMRKKGSMGIFRAFGEKMDIFMGSVLAGDNAQAASPFDFSMGGKGLSAYLPIGASGNRLKEGTTIMFDMSGNYTPYQSDMTRTFAIGQVDKKAYDVHQLSVEMNQWVSENVKPGTPCAEIYNYSLRTAAKHGLENYFMGTTQQAKFVGHGLGLEINEPPVLTPRSKEILQPDMAFAYEPKFVLPGIGAAGIENTFVVNENRVEKITICEEKLVTL